MPEHPMRTLLIFVDAATRQWLEKTLARRRHEAVVADDLESALAALRAEPLPVIVLGVEQPADDVGDVCRRLRAAAPPGDGLLLAVGRETHPADLPAWFAAGVDDYLVACRDTPRLEERLAAAEQRQSAAAAESTVSNEDDRACAREELQAVYDRMSDGVLIADAETRRSCESIRPLAGCWATARRNCCA